MKTVVTEIDGRQYHVKVRDDELEENYSRGLIVGPPHLGKLGLPDDIESRLHAELFALNILTKRDALKRRNDIFSALQATFAINIDRIVECYDA